VITGSRGVRIVASVIVAGALAVTASGCTLISRQATYIQYDPADGIGADLGDLLLRDVRAVLGKDGKALSIVFTAVNTGTTTAVLTLAYEGANGPADQTVRVPAGASVSVGRPDDDTTAIVLFPGDIVPGSNFEVYAQAGKADGTILTIPVFDGTNPLYAELAPPAVAR